MPAEDVKHAATSGPESGSAEFVTPYELEQDGWITYSPAQVREAVRKAYEQGCGDGATAERERVARLIEEERDGPGPDGIRRKHPPEEWWLHGMSYAAVVARGRS